jgi:hypothetical protein
MRLIVITQPPPDGEPEVYGPFRSWQSAERFTRWLNTDRDLGAVIHEMRSP